MDRIDRVRTILFILSIPVSTLLTMQTPSRILIIRLSSLGDIVLTAPAVRAVRRVWPDARMVMAVKRAYEPLARLLPGLDEVLPFEAAEGLGQMIGRVRRERFDVIVDLQANLRSRVIAALGGARRVIRYRKRRLARMGMVYGRKTSIQSRHTVDLYFAALARLGVSSLDRRPELIVHPAAQQEVDRRLRASGVMSGQTVIGLAPGASVPAKRWPVARFARLADRLQTTHHAAVLLIGGPHDHAVATAVADTMTGPSINWAGQLDLAFLPAAVQRCRVFVSNDSGPMHVASAVGTPVVGLFGPTHPCLGFAPLGPRDVALSLDLDCSPCSLHGERPCWKGTHACLDDLSVDRVASELERLLQTATSPQFTPASPCHGR